MKIILLLKRIYIENYIFIRYLLMNKNALNNIIYNIFNKKAFINILLKLG